MCKKNPLADPRLPIQSQPLCKVPTFAELRHLAATASVDSSGIVDSGVSLLDLSAFIKEALHSHGFIDTVLDCYGLSIHCYLRNYGCKVVFTVSWGVYDSLYVLGSQYVAYVDNSFSVDAYIVSVEDFLNRLGLLVSGFLNNDPEITEDLLRGEGVQFFAV